MDSKELMSGIAVVIDDELRIGSAGLEDADTDVIEHIVAWFEREWAVPFVKARALPSDVQWENLLRAASFVLLDWKLWGLGGETVKRHTITEIVRFLEFARKNLVPVFIFTNDDPDDVTLELPPELYRDSAAGSSFVFVEAKSQMWSGDSVDVARLEEWVYGNASVYALKTWDRVLDGAKSELFQAMCSRNMNWPRVFWNAYVSDGAVPSASLTNLINDSLRGRMRLDVFEEARLGGGLEEVPDDELRRLIAETSFRLDKFLPKDEIRCGDLYKGNQGKFWLNLRPDCDCIPREGIVLADVEVYCVEGKKVGPTGLQKMFDADAGSFRERVFESVAFAIVDGGSVVFDFKKLRVLKFSEVSEKRVGRLLHPYVTRVQQRYASYTQRQALPRVPASALPEVAEAPESRSDT